MLSNILFKTLKVFLATVMGLVMLMGSVHAAVEVNSADQAALESVRGLGPSKARAILDERKKNGPFKDSNDLHTRVKGIGEKTVERLMSNGLTVNSKSSVGNQKSAPSKKESKQDLKKESRKETTKESSKEGTKKKTKEAKEAK